MTGEVNGGTDAGRLERRIARLLTRGTYLAVALLAVGVVLLVAAGRSPLDGGPPFDPAQLPADLLALQPAAFLYLGLIAVIATPAARVGASLVGYLVRRERAMAGVAAAILGIMLLSVVLGGVSEG